MSKRSAKFERSPRDYYRTPPEAVEPLLPFLGVEIWFAEPCAGSGDLIRALEVHGHHCEFAGDLEPGAQGIAWGDALEYKADDGVEIIITNPPWSRDTLHALISCFSNQRDTWLLFDADWMHTKQAVPYLKRCEKIVSVGRVSWMQNGTVGFDNCCWYKFRTDPGALWETSFYGRELA